MKALLPLLAVVAIVLAGLSAGWSGIGHSALLPAIPYAAFTVFLGGFCWRVVRWAWTPVPFHIPTTCGQQRSLPWIKPQWIDNPSTAWGVFLRMAGEVLLFRSLFRNNRARLAGERLVMGEEKFLWLGALAFHWALLLILLRHLRLFLEPMPKFVNALEELDGFFLVGMPRIYLSDIIFLAALAYLLLRRLGDPALRYISQFTDYFALFLLLGVGTTGAVMRFFIRADVVNVKQFALSLAALRPMTPATLSPLFLAHLLLVCCLAGYLPFSKLMHMGGVLLSPTRNLANNSRSQRHINPWNYQVKTHTYVEWEEEFHDKLAAAGIPLEEQHAGAADTD